VGEVRNTYSILVGMLEGKTPLRRLRSRWEDNIRMDLREIVWEGLDWIQLGQDRVQWRAPANSLMNLRVP
jgi:hypothetical protein